MDSILVSVKKMLGITADYVYFDPEIIIHINSIFSILFQMGVCDDGSKHPFYITDASDKWNDFSIRANKDLSEIKSYMYLRVRMLFDPPTNSTLMNAINEQIKEFEWRLYIQTDTYDKAGEFKDEQL